ncbi:hypothetical protein CIG15_08315 [Aeromonas veronii]|nr:hypothetical protein CIG15_08315 [Aeromonas veronii]
MGIFFARNSVLQLLLLPLWRAERHLLLCHSAILPFCHSAILPFCHSAILPFCHSAILPFCHSATLPLRSFFILLFRDCPTALLSIVMLLI